MAVELLHVTFSFYAKYLEDRFFFLQKHTKSTLWAKSTALPAMMPKNAFHSNADFTLYCWVMLKSCYINWTQLVLHINTQHVDCLFTLFRYRFSGNNVVESGQVFDNVQGAAYFSQSSTGMGRVPSIAKRDSRRKSTEDINWAPP